MWAEHQYYQEDEKRRQKIERERKKNKKRASKGIFCAYRSQFVKNLFYENRYDNHNSTNTSHSPCGCLIKLPLRAVTTCSHNQQSSTTQNTQIQPKKQLHFRSKEERSKEIKENGLRRDFFKWIWKKEDRWVPLISQERQSSARASGSRSRQDEQVGEVN